jgi:hypothetical protein
MPRLGLCTSLISNKQNTRINLLFKSIIIQPLKVLQTQSMWDLEGNINRWLMAFININEEVLNKQMKIYFSERAHPSYSLKSRTYMTS